MAKIAWALSLWFKPFFVVVLRLLLLLLLLYGLLKDVVVVSSSGVGVVRISATFPAGVIHKLPMFLDGARNPFLGSGSV